MQKMAMMLTSSVFAIALGLSGPAGAGTMGGCKTVAGKARYDVETDCYNSYGPTSGKWSATDRSVLDECLTSVEQQYTADILGCREMYMAAQPILIKKRGTWSAQGSRQALN